MDTDSESTSPQAKRSSLGSEAQRGSDVLWRALFESSLDGILLADSAGIIFAANSAAGRLLGRSEQEIIDAGFAGISGTSDPRLFETIRESSRSEALQEEFVLRRKDGVEIPVEISSVVLTDENGNAVTSVTFRDATARRDAEQALRRSEAMLARAQEVANLGSWELDFASGEAFWSDHRYRMFGVQPGEFCPTLEGFLALVHPEDRARVKTHVQKAVMGEPYRIEYRVILPDASVRHIYAQSDIYFDADGRPVRLVGASLDITERKQAEEALRKSEEQLRRIIESTREGVWLIDRDAVTIYVNPQMAKMLGYLPEEMLGSAIYDYIFEEDRSTCQQIFAQLKQNGGQQIEFRYRRKDNSAIWALVNTNAIYDRTGQIETFLGMFTDITERKCLEEQLRQRSETLQQLMDVAPVALLVAHDPECHEITGNWAGNAMFEGEEGANLSLTPKSGAVGNWRFWRDGAEILAKDLPLQVAATGGIEVRDWEAEAIMPSGTRKFIWGHARPLRDAEARVRGAVAAYQDITTSKQRTEATLRESEERFRNTADTAPVMMWYGDPQKRVIFFNKQVTAFTGLPLEQMIGDGWVQVIHPDDLEAARTAYYEGVDKRASYQVEYRARRADGEYRHMLGTTSPRYVADVYAGQVGTIIDITDVKRRQDEDLARQKLESLGTLANGIAHDFNNLLGGILSQAELASAELAEGTSPETEIGNIRAVAMRGAEIVRQLMVYAGQETDTLELVDVSRLVDETIELLRLLVSKRATIRPQFGTEVPAVLANPAMLRRILINLVTNASEALGEQDGVIRLSTARVTVEPDSSACAGGLPAGDYLQLQVSDTGCGMTPEMQAKILDPFFTTKSPGRGLGLSVAHGIVKRLSGEITIRSQLNHGTTVEIMLPGAEKSLAPDRSNRGMARGTVLMVEDEEVMRIAASRMLQKHGFTVLEATDGSVALEMLRSHTKDITAMLLDVTLPGLASREVLREARLIRPDLRVILTSAYGEKKVAAMFADLGSLPFLRKPYHQADILKLLD